MVVAHNYFWVIVDGFIRLLYDACCSLFLKFWKRNYPINPCQLVENSCSILKIKTQQLKILDFPPLKKFNVTWESQYFRIDLKWLFTNFEYITFFSCPTERNISYERFISIKPLWLEIIEKKGCTKSVRPSTVI